MATDFFIKFDGIDGESVDADHKGTVELLSWSWGLASAAVSGSATASTSNKVVAGALNIEHSYDKASPLLAKYAAQGKFIKQAVLYARKAGDKAKDFFTITLKDVLVTSIQVSGHDGGEMIESVLLNYAAIDIAYSPTDPKGGLGAPVGLSWDVKKNVVK